MANKLPQQKVEAMWQAFQTKQSAEYVQAKCGVNWRTAQRYILGERWHERLAEIRSQAQEQADYDLANAMADSLRLVREYKAKVAEALKGKTVNAKDVTAAELEKLSKLEAFLLGGVESRSEIHGTLIRS